MATTPYDIVAEKIEAGRRKRARELGISYEELMERIKKERQEFNTTPETPE